MNSIRCQVKSLTQLTPNVYQALLAPEKAIAFKPGQYLKFVMSEDDKRPFSIASGPDESLIELQIGAFVAESYPMQVIDRIKSSSDVTIELPFGNAYLREESQRPLLLIAGGTGFSFIKSIIEHLVATKSQREFIVYWGLRDPSASYQLEETQALIDKAPHASFVPVVENVDATWKGKQGLVHEVVMKDIVSLEPYDIYLAGRFDMIGKVRQDFIEHGGDINHMYSDAFDYL